MTEYTDSDALLLMNMTDGFNLKRRHRLIELCGDMPSRLLNESEMLADDIINIVGRSHFDAFIGNIRADALDKEKDKLYRNGVDIITYLDECYPKTLKEIYEFPTLLYAKGNKKLLNTRCVSVVGTRTASRYGINVTHEFVTEFCRAGLTVVSGFARGIDSAAHKAAVEAEGNTVAVVASGLNICYPAENRSLMQKILDTNGLFVSEYNLGVSPASFNFPERNRIISGLSDGLLVPETKIKSGTMITVNLALEQGKNIYVVPSNINSPTGEGSNLLLKQMQGSIVLSPEDVLCAMGIASDKKEKENYQMSIVEQQIVGELEKGETHFEELMKVTALAVGELQTALFELEMNDIIEKSAGNYYRLK